MLKYDSVPEVECFERDDRVDKGEGPVEIRPAGHRQGHQDQQQARPLDTISQIYKHFKRPSRKGLSGHGQSAISSSDTVTDTSNKSVL